MACCVFSGTVQVHNDVTCQSVRGVHKRSLGFPALVQSTIVIILVGNMVCFHSLIFVFWSGPKVIWRTLLII